MPITSDVTINVAKFQPSNIDPSTEKLNQILEKASTSSPRWYEVGAATFRQMVNEGKTQFPVPTLLPNAQDTTVPSREPGRDISVRVYKPDDGKPSRGIFLYLHGGEFVMGTQKELVFPTCHTKMSMADGPLLVKTTCSKPSQTTVS